MLAAAVGMFDGVHLGHQALVKQVCDVANAQGMSPAIFTFTRHPLDIVAPQRAPLMLTTIPYRLDLLCEAGAKEAIALDFNEDMRNLSAQDFMLLLRDKHDVGVLVVGFNHRFGKGRAAGYEECLRIGDKIGMAIVPGIKATIESLPDIPLSSSSIRHLLEVGDVAAASALLGRYYSLPGTVEHGHEIGRTIGFPTANVDPISDRLQTPGAGVYACRALVDGLHVPAMVNIGTRPTVEERGKRTIEAHLIGYDGNIYGHSISLDFIDRIRDEMKFASLQDLRQQLLLDQEDTMRIWSKCVK